MHAVRSFLHQRHEDTHILPLMTYKPPVATDIHSRLFYNISFDIAAAANMALRTMARS
jgi:hypothetical protein